MKVIAGVSNRHVHLKKEHFEILFGKDFEINNIKNLNQPGQFVTDFKVGIKTNKDLIENVTVIGDIREYTQIEISKTDAYKLGINPPVRTSGDILNSEIVTLVGSKGELTTEGCILADRHIHITPKQKEYYGFGNIDKVDILVGGIKGGIISNVSFKVSEDAYFELHLDTDDANSHLIKNNDVLEIIGGNDESQNL